MDAAKPKSPKPKAQKPKAAALEAAEPKANKPKAAAPKSKKPKAMTPAPTMELDGRRGFVERRQGNRHVSVFRVGRLVCGDRDQLCVIRNISAGGVAIEANIVPAIGSRVTVELRSDRRLDATVRWSRPREAGVNFDAPIDVAAMLKEERPSILRLQPRAPRFIRHGAVHVAGTTESVDGVVANISINGVGIIGVADFQRDEAVVVSIEGLGAAHGVVRWNARGEIGVRLTRPLSYRALADWLDARADQTAP